jgi:hypothetical protein
VIKKKKDRHLGADGIIILKVMAVFWVVAPCSLVEVYDRPDDGGSKDL